MKLTNITLEPCNHSLGGALAVIFQGRYLCTLSATDSKAVESNFLRVRTNIEHEAKETTKKKK